ncbi:MAG: PAS domain-containing protein, partial [Pseudomonadota bacterium]
MDRTTLTVRQNHMPGDGLAHHARKREFLVSALAGPTLLGFAALVGWLTAFGFSFLSLTFLTGLILLFRRVSANERLSSSSSGLPGGLGAEHSSDLTESHLAWIADCHPDPLVLLDGEGRIVMANQASVGLVGPDALGKLVSTVFRNPALLECINAARI